MGKRNVRDRHSARLIPSLPFCADVWAGQHLSGRHSSVSPTGNRACAMASAAKRLNGVCATTHRPAYRPFKFFVSVVQYLRKSAGGLVVRQTFVCLALVNFFSIFTVFSGMRGCEVRRGFRVSSFCADFRFGRSCTTSWCCSFS